MEREEWNAMWSGEHGHGHAHQHGHGEGHQHSVGTITMCAEEVLELVATTQAAFPKRWVQCRESARRLPLRAQGQPV